MINCAARLSRLYVSANHYLAIDRHVAMPKHEFFKVYHSKISLRSTLTTPATTAATIIPKVTILVLKSGVKLSDTATLAKKIGIQH